MAHPTPDDCKCFMEDTILTHTGATRFTTTMVGALHTLVLATVGAIHGTIHG